MIEVTPLNLFFLILVGLSIRCQSQCPLPQGNCDIDKFRNFKIDIPQYDERMALHGVPFIPRKLDVGVLVSDHANTKYFIRSLQHLNTAKFNVHILYNEVESIVSSSLHVLGFQFVRISKFDRNMTCDSYHDNIEILRDLNLDVLLHGVSHEFDPLLSLELCQDIDKRETYPQVTKNTVMIIHDQNGYSEFSKYAGTSLTKLHVFLFRREFSIWSNSATSFFSSQFERYVERSNSNYDVVPLHASLVNMWNKIIHVVSTLVTTSISRGLYLDIDSVEISNCEVHYSKYPADMYVRTRYG